MPFQKGNQEWKKRKTQSPGRPPRSTEEKYLQATVNCVKLKDWKRIVTRAMEDAKKGDKDARKWLSDWLMGKPVERTELSGPEGGPIEMAGTVYDLSKLSDEQLDALIALLEAAQPGGGEGAPGES